MIEAGKVLQERYRVEKQIGAGGMGAVFIATDERFGSTVAIKETFFTDDKFRKAFEREARLLNSLRHPALPRVSDHFVDGNGQFLVMEYIDGDDLSEQLESEGKVFTVKEVLGWAEQLLDALEYLHSQEMPVIHRDIKPQNLKLTSRGQIILLDFGLAKGNPTNSETGTAAKSVFGYSRNYASIEQIQGSGTDPRSDLYSLSATLYHLLTGVPPADALTRAMNVLSDKPDPLIDAYKIRPEVPIGVSRVLYEAMALNAEQRPASARAMLDRLLAVKDEAPSPEAYAEASPDTNIYSQKTRVYTDDSKISNLKQSEVKTETFSNEESKVTQIKKPITGELEKENTRIYPLAGTTASSGKSRRGMAIGAALAGLLAICCGAYAAYIYKPEVFGRSGTTPANTETEKKPMIVIVPADNANVTETNANSESSNTTVVTNTNTATETKRKEIVAQTDTKQTDTKPRTEVVAPSKKNDPSSMDDPPEINTDEDDNNDDDEDASKPAKNPKTKQKFPAFVWRKMSPEDRQKLKEALELNRQQQEERRKQQQEERRIRNQQRIPKPPTPY